MMRMAKLQNVGLLDVAHILFPRRMVSCRVRCFSSNLEDAAREDKLDFITASKILFSSPAKPKKFGFDFHLVQFFFACLPSLAVYLVAQYARYDIKKMEAEVEIKKKLAEEKLAEELEQESESSSEAGFSGILKKHELNGKVGGSSKVSSREKEAAFQELKLRFDALEKIVREMTSVEAVKTSSAESQMKQEKQSSNRTVASTNGKGDVGKNLKEKSKNKENCPSNNADSKSASQLDKLHHARDESPGAADK